MFGRKVRAKDILQVLNELDLLYSLGWRGSLFIADDNLAAIPNIKELLRQIATWQHSRSYLYSFYTQISVNYLKDPELLELLVDANFGMLFVGIESPSLKVLQSIGKKQNVHTPLIKTLKNVQSKGIEVISGLILGFDTDPQDIFQQQIDFIEATDIAKPLIGLLTALPGTRFQHRLIKENRFIKESAGNHTHILDLNFEPKMNKDYLIDGYINTLKYLYTPKNYFNRCLGFLKRAKFKKHSFKLSIKHRKLLKIFLTQITSSYWQDYLKFLSKVIIQCLNKLKEALYLAVVGHHLIKLTEEMMVKDKYVEKITLRI